MRRLDRLALTRAGRTRQALTRLSSALCLASVACLASASVWSQPVASKATLAASQPSATRPALAASLSPEQQLQAVRDALLQSALAGSTRVRSTAWLNEDGQLMEVSQFSSDAVVRGVRVVEYLPPNEPARIEASVEPALPPGQTCSPRHGPERLQHPLVLASSLRWPGHGAHLGLAQESLAIVESGLAQAATTTGMPLETSGPAAATTPALGVYERAVYGREEPAQPLRLRVELSPASIASALPEGMQALAAQAWLRLPMMFGPSLSRLDLLVTLSLARAGEPARWQQQVVLSLPVSKGERPVLRLQHAALEALQQATQSWWAEVAEQLRCVPLTFEARRAGEGRFKLMAGGNAGLRRGDRLLITDSSHIPRRILEAGAAEHLALVEVEKVGPDRAELRQVAGPALTALGAWVALPF